MSKPIGKVVFFDIGGTLGDVELAEPLPHVPTINLYGEVLDGLDALREAGARLGVISNIGEVTTANVSAVNVALQACGVYTRLDESLILYGAKDSTAIFKKAAAAAGHAAHPRSCMFVGEDAQERSYATKAGMKVATPSNIFGQHSK